MDLRKLARGKPCLVRIPGVCNHDPETVVGAHINRGGIGGMGMKSGSDLPLIWACSNCHDVIDGRVASFYGDDLDTFILEGLCRTLVEVNKLITIKVA